MNRTSAMLLAMLAGVTVLYVVLDWDGFVRGLQEAAAWIRDNV